jgi:hypothetical protein
VSASLKGPLGASLGRLLLSLPFGGQAGAVIEEDLLRRGVLGFPDLPTQVMMMMSVMMMLIGPAEGLRWAESQSEALDHMAHEMAG